MKDLAWAERKYEIADKRQRMYEDAAKFWGEKKTEMIAIIMQMKAGDPTCGECGEVGCSHDGVMV